MPTFAHFDDRNPPSGALCLSAFLVAEDSEGLLVGRMRRSTEWNHLDRVEVERVIESGRWVLPASHLHIGETPFEAARRIVKEQLAAPSYEVRECSIFSHHRASPDRHPASHWDLCFVFEADVQLTGTPSWFEELRRIPRRSIRHELFARGHGDIVADMGFLPPMAQS